jgi:hypothetical protein
MRKREDRLNQQLERLCAEDKGDRIYNTQTSESDRTPGKYQLSIEGVPLQGEFDSENEAMIFMAGFVAGASIGFRKCFKKKQSVSAPNNFSEVVFERRPFQLSAGGRRVSPPNE